MSQLREAPTTDINSCTKMNLKEGSFKRYSPSSSLAYSMPERCRGYKTTPSSSILSFSQVPVEARNSLVQDRSPR